MLKRLLAALFALIAATAFAAVDVNKASQAELETVKGIGPTTSGKILDERKKSSFKDWPDLVERVKGVGEGNAAKFSAGGLTVNGQPFKGAAAPAAKASGTDKPAKAKTDDKAAAAPASPPAPASAAKTDDKADKKAAKKAEKAAKADAAASAATSASKK